MPKNAITFNLAKTATIISFYSRNYALKKSQCIRNICGKIPTIKDAYLSLNKKSYCQ